MVERQIFLSALADIGSSPILAWQSSSELRRLSHELGTGTKLAIVDNVAILEHLKVEEPAMESVGLMFIP